MYKILTYISFPFLLSTFTTSQYPEKEIIFHIIKMELKAIPDNDATPEISIRLFKDGVLQRLLLLPKGCSGGAYPMHPELEQVKDNCLRRTYSNIMFYNPILPEAINKPYGILTNKDQLFEIHFDDKEQEGYGVIAVKISSNHGYIIPKWGGTPEFPEYVPSLAEFKKYLKGDSYRQQGGFVQYEITDNDHLMKLVVDLSIKVI